ncbi:hypothetical protein KC347_g299 [Hortaea werneckii]|nr:hypothetical protein KC347_g299 [Hortaea werneckii]
MLELNSAHQCISSPVDLRFQSRLKTTIVSLYFLTMAQVSSQTLNSPPSPTPCHSPKTDSPSFITSTLLPSTLPAATTTICRLASSTISSSWNPGGNTISAAASQSSSLMLGSGLHVVHLSGPWIYGVGTDEFGMVVLVVCPELGD